MPAGQLENGRLHVSDSRVKADHLKPVVIDRLAGMHGIRIDQNNPPRRREMFVAFVSKRLATSLNETDHVIIVTVPRKGMLDVKRLQMSHVELRIMS